MSMDSPGDSRSIPSGACIGSWHGLSCTTARRGRFPLRQRPRVRQPLLPHSENMDRAQIGKDAEDRATEYLRGQGLEILSRNFRRRLGELDVIARSGDVLIIAEVRTRSSQNFGGAAASV